jgi:hypothetical protein
VNMNKTKGDSPLFRGIGGVKLLKFLKNETSSRVNVVADWSVVVF